MNGTWIWLSDGVCTENERGCFAAEFTADDVQTACALRITAVTRYTAWLNGRLLGRGPARTTPGHAYYDTYDLTPLLRAGRMNFALRSGAMAGRPISRLQNPEDCCLT